MASVGFLSDTLKQLNDPFSRRGLIGQSKGSGPSTDEGKFILELVAMAQDLRTNRPVKFWTDVHTHQRLNVKNAAVVILSVFGSACTCESNFSLNEKQLSLLTD